MSLFTDRRPGPKGPRKATGGLRQKVLALRAQGHSVAGMAYVLTVGSGFGANRLMWTASPRWPPRASTALKSRSGPQQ